MNEKNIIDSFAEKMYTKIQMRHGRYQPLGWRDLDIKRLIFLMKGELAELEEGFRNKDNQVVKSEAIDIANYAMFIHEITKS